MPPSFSLSGQVRIVPSWTDSMSTTDVVDSVTIQLPLSYTNGTGPAQADAYWRDVRTVTGSTTDTVNLAALPINVFGGTGTLDLEVPRLIYVRNLSTGVRLQYSLIGGSNQEIPPGGVFLWTATTDTAAGKRWLADDQLIEIQNVGATGANYEIVLVGVKA